MNYKIIDKCMLCRGSLSNVLSLGETGLANELLLTDEEVEKFPLNLMRCNFCSHLQIDTIVDQKRLYSDYNYVSDTSDYNREHFKKYSDKLLDKKHYKFVVDIGSNDGLFLKFFKVAGCKVLGIDPAANIALHAIRENNINTKIAFFNEDTANEVLHEYGKADLITANNCFAHNENLTSFVKGVKTLLSEDGMFVFEVSYAMRVLENGLIDLTYHEHMHHHHLKPLIYLFSKFGMSIVDAEEIPNHGGSIRVYVKHSHHMTKNTDNLNFLMQKEVFAFEDLLKKFVVKVETCKKELVSRLNNLVSVGKKVSILGYPAKAATLCSYFNLDKNLITDVFDDNKLKIGKYSHNGIKILDTKEIKDKKPDYLLVLSWNYADELINKHKNSGAKFIVPLPNIRIV